MTVGTGANTEFILVQFGHVHQNLMIVINTNLQDSLTSQTFTHGKRKVQGHPYTAFVTLPESGKDQSDHRTDDRMHSNICIPTLYMF